MKKLLSSQKTRFGLVGIINTLLDVGVLNLFVAVIGVPLVISNAISTTVAMIISFILNKKAVFHSDERSKRQAFSFVVVTLMGLWIIQTAVVVFVYSLLGMLPETLRLNVAKSVGIVFSLTWNYIWYKKVVFKQN